MKTILTKPTNQGYFYSKCADLIQWCKFFWWCV